MYNYFVTERIMFSGRIGEKRASAARISLIQSHFDFQQLKQLFAFVFGIGHTQNFDHLERGSFLMFSNSSIKIRL